jgi:hypothetical protein
MKKLPTISAFICLAILTTSCSKTSSDLINNQHPSTTPLPSSKEVTSISNWLTPASFYLNSDRLGQFSISGVMPFTSATQISYDKSTHVELVYARIPDQRGIFQYKKLSFGFGVDIEGKPFHVSLDYSLDPAGLRLYFKNSDYLPLATAVDNTVSENWNYRYVVIPETKYQNTDVDWNDLAAVASILNFSL